MEDDIDRGPVSEGNLRFLKVLVTTLTLTMIGGLIAIFTLLVIRFPTPGGLVLPEAVDLPDGITADAVTFGPDWIAVVSDDQILMFDRASGDLRQTVDLSQ